MTLPKSKYTILIIDDDEIFCDSLKDAFDSTRFEVLTAHTKQDGLFICSANKIDVVLLDQKLPDGEGHALCPTILEFNDKTKIIFVTAYPSFDNAVNAIKAGAYDYLSKPFNLEELRLAVHRSIDMQNLERVKDRESYRIDKERDDSVLVGGFGGTAYIRDMMRMASSAESPVLITGETGTGKNVVARAIHFGGVNGQTASPFIKVNCAALPESLIEDELFGHEKGAFTDARASRKGLFELADGGTLLLDEIGDMPLHLQAKLLGVLDDGKIRRLGGQSMIPINVRVIAATNRSLEQAIEEKTFRQDLYYRLSVIRIHIPPLRDRALDIPQLCNFFIDKMSGMLKPNLSDSQLKRLMCYNWPGNVRELKNIIERSMLLHGNDLRPSELIHILPSPTPGPVQSLPQSPSQVRTLEQVEKEYIQQVLNSHSFNLTRSAKALGISLSTLKRKVKVFQFHKVNNNEPGGQNEPPKFG
jgi:DNA-binding NtrC family response regulator